MYDRYFGFSKRPFTDLADQAFLTIPPYRAAYTCLRRGLLERCGLLLLTGIPGTGKTTLLHHLMADLEDQAHCIFFWNTHLGFGDLLDYVCSDLGLHSLPTGQAEKFQALEACLRTQFAEGGEVVLMLDDAQNLPDETLDGLYQLTQLEMVGRPLLRIVLSGQPVLESRLAELPALQSLALDAGAHCRLDALDDDAATLYIRERLLAAGHGGEDLFEADALQEVIAYAQGGPRLINLICSRALLLTCCNSEQRVSATRVREAALDVQQLDWPLTTPSTTSAITPGDQPQSWSGERPDTAFPVETRPVISVIPSIQARDLLLVFRAFAHLPHHVRHLLISILLLLIVLGAVAVRYLDLYLDSALPLPQTNAASPTAIDEPASSPSTQTGLVQYAASQRPTPATSGRTVTKRIQILLDRAERQMAALHYTRPVGKSALDSYRKALRLDPKNADALRGIKRIKTSFVHWADSATARGDLAKARRHLQTALAIDPRDAVIQTRLDWIRHEAMEANRPLQGYRGRFKGSIGRGWVNRD